VSELGWHAKAHWTAVLEHPRLVFDQLSPEEIDMVYYYLVQSRPFTVVLRQP